MTVEQFTLLVGTVFAIVFAYVPGLASWYEPLEATKKRLIMLGMMVVVALVIFGLSCANIWASITCDQRGVLSLLNTLILAIIANQGTYLILPKVGLNK